MKVTIWRASTAIASVIQGAAQRHDVRDHLYAQLEVEGVQGWGEISPQPHDLNGDPGVDAVIEAIRDEVVPRLRRSTDATSRGSEWSRVHQFAGPRSASVVAWSLLEMALLDVHLRLNARALPDLWPGRYESRTMATVSLLEDSLPAISPDVERLRVKVRPGVRPSARLAEIRDLERPVIADYNCSATGVDEVLRDLEVLSSALVVVAVEQPFAPGNLVDHAALHAHDGVTVSLDEGVRSIMDLRHIARYGAASLVCIKPARVGGLALAHSMIEEARRLGLRPYVGGFFESPLARTVHRQLVRAFIDEPSDVAPVAFDAPPVGGTPTPGGLGWRPEFRPTDELLTDVETERLYTASRGDSPGSTTS